MTELKGFTIGFDAKRAFANRSGLGSYGRNTLESLRNNFPENSFVLFTARSQTPGMIFNNSGFKVISPAFPDNRLYASFWRSFLLAGKLKSAGINLFHGLSNELPANIHRLAFPSVVTIHDLIFLKYPGFYRSVDRFIYFRKVKYACKVATRIIAVSNQTRNDLINTLGIPDEKVEVAYQPVSQRFYNIHEGQKIKEVKEKYHLPEKFILSVGTIEERKNQLNILRAVVNEKIDRDVLFVGKVTGYIDKLKEFILRHRMENRVRFISGLPDEDLPAIYKLAGVMVYLSRYEGFGLPVIEAMACGCPVVSSDASCLPETAGGAALLCNPDEIDVIGKGISIMIENDEIMNEYVRKGKERAIAFTPVQSANNLVAVYIKAISDEK